jgi:hypothetical protein
MGSPESRAARATIARAYAAPTAGLQQRLRANLGRSFGGMGRLAPLDLLSCEFIKWINRSASMARALSQRLQGDVLTVQPYRDEQSRRRGAGRSFLLEVVDESVSTTLMAALPLLDRLLAEKVAAVRERQLEEMVDFLAARMLSPSPIDLEMAQRLAKRHARLLNEFGWFTAEELADANRSQAGNRTALADNWRKRRQIFAVPHPDKTARERDIYPAFQFEGGKPIKAVQRVLEVFGERKSPWKLALWFASNNGRLPGSARPVDLLQSNPEAVVEAARHDTAEAAA